MNQFNLRVYGILINELNEVLISDEYEFGTFFTKFPGGGVEYGEGISDALKREFKEELNAEIISSQLLYFNEYFQESVFHKNVQVTCFYYHVKCKNIEHLGKVNYKIPLTIRGEKQRWVKLSELKENDLSFQTDQWALQSLRKNIISS